MPEDNDLQLKRMAAIVSAYVTKNPVSPDALATLIALVRDSLDVLKTNGSTTAEVKLQPAVPIKKSITPDYIISLEDGAKFRSMKRPLRSRYGMSPDEYREKWGLPKDYPMVAPNYAKVRSQLAKSAGLGRKSKPVLEPASAGKPRRRQK